MSRRNRTWLHLFPFASRALVALALAIACAGPTAASTIQMKDGRILHGRIGETAGLAENPQAPETGGPRVIKFIDNDLSRTFVPTFQIGNILEADTGEVPERIRIQQNVATAGNRMQRVGPIAKIGPFNEFGRRVLTMMTDKGALEVIQGITMITPQWTKVEGMRTGSRTPIVWDMRIATSSLPTATLQAIFKRSIDPKNLEQRLKVVRLLLQAERYKDAQQELEQVIKDFPEEKELPDKVRPLRQLNARTALAEIEVRKRAGQHALAYRMLEKFPAKDTAGEILQQVRTMRDEYQATQQKLQTTYQELKKLIESLPSGPPRQQSEAMLEEMGRELGINTIDRLSDYLRLRDDASLGAEQKISLAISGWLLGSSQGETNLAVTLSLVNVRDVVRKYLSEPVKLEREKLLNQLRASEGASPSLVAQLLASMKPPLEAAQTSPGKPGFYEQSVPIGIQDEADVRYYVQLPLQYDPYVRYPTIVTLNGAGTTPEQQIDWWAGAQGENGRLGQATRFGYIVIAVDWMKEAQSEYGFTAREHAAVLTSLRDACRRFSIDTDRVFLSGHSMGGNAAWDLGLAHPDLWAGVIPIVAQADKYCAQYWGNADLVPFYFVSGELDGDKTIKNSRDWDRYMSHRYDVTITEYIGRGHEDFYEDIQNIFDWMGRRQRDFFPKEFTVTTMRPWDNYFWWFEGRDFPERAMVDPVQWPPKRGVRPLEISAKVTATNGLNISTGDVKGTIWLSPQLLDFDRRISVTLNGRSLRSGGLTVEPDLNVMLEDVRTRGDRQHPFWAKLEG
ncbi:MAG: alpha/beta hydrolase-fold protein [Pirellulales bacterium]